MRSQSTADRKFEIVQQLDWIESKLNEIDYGDHLDGAYNVRLLNMDRLRLQEELDAMDLSHVPCVGSYWVDTEAQEIEGVQEYLSELDVAIQCHESNQQAAIESEWCSFFSTVQTDRKHQTSADWNIFSQSLSCELQGYGIDKQWEGSEWIEFDSPEIHPAVIQSNGLQPVYSAARRVDRCTLQHIASVWG